MPNAAQQAHKRGVLNLPASSPPHYLSAMSIRSSLLLAAALGLAPAVSAQVVLLEETFDTDGAGTRYTVQNGFYTDSGNYFARVDVASAGTFDGGQQYQAANGFFFGGRDMDDVAPANGSVTLSATADLSSATGVTLSFRAAAADGGSFDARGSALDDYLVIEYSTDEGSTYQECLDFRGTNVPGAGGNAGLLAVDTDNDGVGDGVALTPTFQTFSCAIPDAAASLKVRFRAQTTGGDELFGIDDFRVTSPQFSGTILDTSDCGTPTGGVDFERPSSTSRCFPIISGTNNLGVAQRFTLFFQIVGVGPNTQGYSRVAMRGEIKLGPGESATNKFSLRTFDTSTDPDGAYELVLFAELGSAPSLTSSAVELDRVPFTKGGPTPNLRAGEALTVFPNPSTDAATLRFAVTEAGQATLVIYDALGREVARPIEGTVSGAVEASFDTSALPAGLYVARLTTGAGTETVRLSVVR